MAESSPVLQWVGSKRAEAEWIVKTSEMASRISPRGALYEVFAGSAAVFFKLSPKRAVVNDVVTDVTVLYGALSVNPDRVYYHLMQLVDAGHDEQSFLRARSAKTVELFKSAARTLFLNRTCYNGLYRTNDNGDFNVPYGGNKNPSFPSLVELRIAGDELRRALILNRDYGVAVSGAGEGDVVFADPPYDKTYQGYAGKKSEVYGPIVCKRLKEAWTRGASVVATVPSTPEWVAEAKGWMKEYPMDRLTTVSQSGHDKKKLSQSMWVSV